MFPWAFVTFMHTVLIHKHLLREGVMLSAVEVLLGALFCSSALCGLLTALILEQPRLGGGLLHDAGQVLLRLGQVPGMAEFEVLADPLDVAEHQQQRIACHLRLSILMYIKWPMAFIVTSSWK